MDTEHGIGNKNTQRISYILLTWFFILWCGGLTKFLPLTIASIISLLISLIGIWYGIKRWTVKIRNLDFLIIGLTFVFPIISSIQANYVFGQPFIMGLLSLRQCLNLLIFYYFIKIFDTVDIAKIICNYQIIIMIVDAILLYVLQIDSNRLINYLPVDDNTAFIKSESVENELRGSRLVLGDGLTILALSFWVSKYWLYRKKSDLLKIILTCLFVIFVTKSRVGLIVCLLVCIYPLTVNLKFKNFVKLVGVVGCILIVLLAIPGLASRFLVISDLLGNRQTQGTGDFSGVARLNEILIAIPYIKEYPLFGVGNISYHFKDGFSGVLGDYFFVADIGIIGMLFIGGIFFCFLYFGLMRYSLRKVNTCKYPVYRMAVRIIIVINMVRPFMGSVPMLDNSLTIALIIYLVFRKKYEVVSC